jgi:hypothetical protein
MIDKKNISIHFIEEGKDHVVSKQLTSKVPRSGDEIRLGGKDRERFYKITRVIWIYDEPDSPFERINIGIELST